MTQKTYAKGLKRKALTVALGVCFAGSIHAQSNITGTIFGQVPAGAGNTVLVENLDTGLKRTIAIDSAGRYQATALPNGRYKVTLQKDGATVSVRENVNVNISSGTDVSFAAAGAGATTDLESVVVRGGIVPVIDISQTDTRTVLTAEQLNKISVARDIASVALLAPSVVRNDSYTANGNTVPSFGGSASSENAYFINGYAVTNPLTSIGFTTLPFDAISEQQILTGGYGAEFGRSTGGVINIVTKRGTNEWKGGVYAIWQPESMRASPRNTYYPDTKANPATDGTLNVYRNQNQFWSQTTGVYVGGPLIKDRLFIYADAEIQRDEGAQVRSTRLDAVGTSAQRAGWDEYSNKFPRWALKADWNITDNHILEFTGISDVSKRDSNRSGFTYADFKHDFNQFQGLETEDDSKVYVGKYTGYLTDDLTVSLLYGQQKIDHDTSLFGYSDTCPRIAVGTAPNARAPGIPSANYNGCQRYTAIIPLDGTLTDETKGGRFDVSYRLGNHDLRVGYERQEATSFTGSRQPGNYAWSYVRQNNPNVAIDASHGVGSPASGGGLGTQGYYVNRIYQTNQANVKTLQRSQYIEDRWQVTDNLLLSLGVRNEQFTNYTAAGEAYISQDKQLAPRLGFSWDVRGDSTLKMFGNAGRYHLVLPNNAAVRGASASLRTNEYFTYTGVDATTGAPTGLTPIPVTPGSPGVCPGTNTISANLECGVAPNPLSTTAKDIKAHYQDEYIIGFEHAYSPAFSWGAKLTYRDLKSAIDDTCAQILGGQCRNFNPGEDNSFYLPQPDGTLKLVHFTAEQLGLPKLKRKYYALDLFAEHPFSDKWYGKVEYTFSRNWGNTEGQLASDLDIGAGGQVDVSRTQDWDLPQLMVGSNGLLPNHRAHQLKAFGYYQLNEEWRYGATLIMASGRPRNCTSFYPTADAGLYNGSFYWYCGLAGSGTAPGSANYAPPSADFRISTRGSQGETPLTFQLNLNVAYVPEWAGGKVTFQADLINALNRQVPGSYNPRYSASRTQVNPVYNQELNYSAPRYLRLTARYDF